MSMFTKITPTNFIVGDGVPLIDAIHMLNTQEQGQTFLLVVNGRSQLVGTLTDGDIRRWIVRGKTIHEKVCDVMFSQPIVGTDKHSPIELEKLISKVIGPNIFLPVINSEKKVIEIIVGSSSLVTKTDALIMAGGYGKRLGIRTQKTPKPLIEVEGKALLEHVIVKLRESGANRVFISVHYLAEQICNFVEQKRYSEFVTILYEEEPMGTAGSISMLPQSSDTNFLISNCDIITGLNYKNFLDFHFLSKSQATIAVTEHQYQIPFGVVEYSPNGAFLGIKEKPQITNYVAAGLYCLSSNFINETKENGYIDMPKLLARGKSLKCKMNIFPIHEDWVDVGTPEDLSTFDVLSRF